MLKITSVSPYFGKPNVVRTPFFSIGCLRLGLCQTEKRFAECGARLALGQVCLSAVGLCVPDHVPDLQRRLVRVFVLKDFKVGAIKYSAN